MTSGERFQGDPRARRRGRGRDCQVVHRRDLAGQTDDAEAVGPVGRDFEVDDGVIVAEWFNGGDLEPTEAEPLGNLLAGRGHIDEVTQP